MSCRPRRRSKYSAADELDQYSDAEYDDDLGSGDLGRDEGGRKKVGRPIAYKGDPNSPHLTEDERRRIKRWVPRADAQSPQSILLLRNLLFTAVLRVAVCTVLGIADVCLTCSPGGLPTESQLGGCAKNGRTSWRTFRSR